MKYLIVDKTFGVFSMGKFKRLIVMLTLGLCAASCFAKQICFQVVQYDNSATDVTEQSLTIEDEVLNKFFEYGFIVTNAAAQVAVSDGSNEKIYKTGIGEAFNGFSDYFVQINLFFSKDENTTSSKSDLKKIDFSIANAKTGTKLADSCMENIKLEHKKDDLKKVSSTLVSEINKALKENKTKA